MKAIILAGGKGTRLQGVVSDIPKPMAQVAGKPFLEYLILQLKSYSIRDIVLSVGYKCENIISFFADGSKWGVRITYSQETKPLGTGGAIRNAITSLDDQNILILNGDSYIDVDVTRYMDWHDAKKCLASIVATKIKNTDRYGTVELDREERINKFTEKGEHAGSGWINAGMYIFHRSVFENNFSVEYCSLEKEILPGLIGKGLCGYRCTEPFIDIGTPESYHLAAAFFSKIKNRI